VADSNLVCMLNPLAGLLYILNGNSLSFFHSSLPLVVR
jgi:hypothetical protein